MNSGEVNISFNMQERCRDVKPIREIAERKVLQSSASLSIFDKSHTEFSKQKSVERKR